MTGRTAHLVGSLPGDSAADAMGTAYELLGPHLTTLPDGETGERRDWIIPMIEGLRTHPDLEVGKPGDWSDYDKTPRLSVRKGHTLYGANLDLGIAAAAAKAWPDFRRIAADRADLSFQVGIPGDFDLAMFTLGPAVALRRKRPFTEALLRELRSVHELAGDRVLFQIEVPAELVLVAQAPGPARPIAARLMARGITRFAAAAPVGARFGLHLCLGDMNNKALGKMADVGPIVALSNAVVAGWPDGRPLEYVHAPFAAADHPAPVDPQFYAPLAGLALPPGLRFIGGYAHEGQPLEDQKRIRHLIDDGVGRPTDVAAACGLGRRTPEGGRAVLTRTAELLAD